MAYECNREIAVKEATKEQLEERIAEATECLNRGLLTVSTINKSYLEAAISILQTGFPF